MIFPLPAGEGQGEGESSVNKTASNLSTKFSFIRSDFIKVAFAIATLLATTSLHAATLVGPWVPKFKGIDYSVNTNLPTAELPHLMVIHALRVDLTDQDIRLFPTPRISNYVANVREVAAMTVSDFLRTNHLQAAINANFFNADGQQLYLSAGTPMTLDGLSISEGVMVKAQTSPQNSAALLFDASNRVSMIASNWPAASTEGIVTAVSGTYPILVGGVDIARPYVSLPQSIHRRQPRTAFGFSQDRRYLFLVAIDGRQGDEGYSDGAYDYETAEWLLLLGAHDGVNMDGGGSTTLVVQDTTGFPERLNHPSTVADSGRERTVGSHFGVYAKPLPGFINDVKTAPDDRSATITWTTVEPATAQVQYGTTIDSTNRTPADTTLARNHTVQLSGLTPNTGYYYRIVSATETEQHISANFYFVTTNYVTTNLIFDVTHPWRFTSANLQTANWTSATYNDSAWNGPGPGLFWVDTRATGPNPDVLPKNTPMPANTSGSGFPFRTYYLRTRFVLTNAPVASSLLFSGFVDDGAVFYINGTEAYRLRMRNGTVDNQTLANGYPCDGDATCPDEFVVSLGSLPNLATGENVLAVEVHNYNASSADITFGLALSQIVPVVRSPTLAVSGSGNLVTLTWERAGFVLQWAGTPEGPWSDVDATYITSAAITASEASRFYRLRAAVP